MILCLSLLAPLAACGDDEDEHEHGAELTPECQAIVDACHDVDDGTGRISECHEMAHEDDSAQCATDQEECVGLCEAAAAG